MHWILVAAPIIQQLHFIHVKHAESTSSGKGARSVERKIIKYGDNFKDK